MVTLFAKGGGNVNKDNPNESDVFFNPVSKSGSENPDKCISVSLRGIEKYLQSMVHNTTTTNKTSVMQNLNIIMVRGKYVKNQCHITRRRRVLILPLVVIQEVGMAPLYVQMHSTMKSTSQCHIQELDSANAKGDVCAPLPE